MKKNEMNLFLFIQYINSVDSDKQSKQENMCALNDVLKIRTGKKYNIFIKKTIKK